MDAATIRILVSANSAGVGTGLSPGLTALNNFERQANRAIGRIKTQFAGLSGAQKVAGGVAVGIGLMGAAMAAATGPAIRFESAFAGVRKTVNGTDEELAAIRQGILDMSAVMPTAAEDLASIAENAGQLGIAAPDVLAFTKTIAQLGETTDLSFDSASQSLARFLNITGGGASKIGEVADVLVELGNNTATTESQIVSFATRIAGAFTIAGAHKGEILAVAAAYSSLGIEAEAGGTALSLVITSIADAALDGGPKLKTFAEVAGLLPEEFRQIAEDTPVEALVLFEAGLGRIIDSGGSVTEVLDDLGFSGIRTSRVLKAGALDVDGLRNSLGLTTTAIKEGSAAQEEYDKRTETTAARIQIFKNRLTALAIQLATPLLGGLADSADLAGDALERMSDIFEPIGDEIVELFENAAKAFGFFLKALGGPALKLAIVALMGFVTALGIMLDLLNLLGPAGLILAVIAIDVIFLGAASAGLASALIAVGAAAWAAASGLTAMQVAMSAGPWVVVAAAIALVVKALYDAGKAGEAAASGFREGFIKAIEDANFDEVLKGLDDISGRMDYLKTQDRVGDGLADGWDSWGQALKSAGQVLTPLTENTIVNARAELEALEGVLKETQIEDYARGISNVAFELGITEEATAALAEKQGVSAEITNIGASALNRYTDANSAAVDGIAEAAGELGVFRDKLELSILAILNGTAEMHDFERALGITGSTLGFFVDQLDGVDIEDFADPETMGPALDAVERLSMAYGEVAGEIGITTDEMVENLLQVDSLANSYGVLRNAVNQAESALNAINAQVKITEAATEQFDIALKSIKETGGLEAAAMAMRTLSLEYAASGVSAAEATAKQRELYLSFLEAAVGAGVTEEAAQAVAVAMGLVPDEILAEITLDGQQVHAEAEVLSAELEGLSGSYVAELLAEDYASPTIDLAALAANLFPGVYTADMQASDNASGTLEDIAEAADAAAEDKTLDFGLNDYASADLALIQGYVDNIKDKTVTVTTVAVGGRGSQPPSYNAAGALRFDAGGFNNPILERPGTAGIYAPHTRARIFAEPVTGGESYIPLGAGNRSRSLAIWAETGKRIGALNASGTGAGSAMQGGGATGGDSGAAAMARGGIMHFARGGISSFASGGITSGVFSNGPGQLPTVIVDVAIDAAGIGQLELDLAPAERMITSTADAMASASRRADDLTSYALPEAGAQFTATAITAEEAGRRMAGSLRPGEFLQTFSEISGWAKESFRDWLGVWDGTVEGAISKLDAAGLETEHIFNEIAAQGIGTGVDIYNAFDKAGLDIAEVAKGIGSEMLEGLDSEQFLVEFSRISGWAQDSFVDWLAAFDETSAEMVETLRADGATAAEIFAEVFSNTDALDKLEDAGVEMGHIFEQIFHEAADDAEVLEIGIGLIADSVDDVERSTRKAADAFDLLNGKTRSVLDTQIDYLDAVDRVKESIAGSEEDGPGVFGLLSESARDNYDELLRAGDAMREYGLEIAGSGVSAMEAIEQFDGLRKEFQDLATDAGLSEAEVQILTDTLFGVPEITIAELAIEGQEAVDDVNFLGDLLVQLADGSYVPVIDADTELIDEATQAILTELGIIDAATPMPTPDVDSTQFDESIAAAGDAIEALDGMVATTITRNTIETTQTTKYKGGTYTVEQGDSWWAIAAKLWGDPTRFGELAAKNGRDPNAAIYPGQVVKFAGGGLYEPEIAPDGAMRLFAEPGTGGEAFIPLANDWRRPRAMATWLEAGRAMGVSTFANGGLTNLGMGRLSAGSSAPSISASIVLEVNAAPGMDAEQVATIAGDKVRTALADAGRDLLNMR